MLELILHLEATPMHIGSRLVWRMLAGTIMRPRATSERMSSGERFSRCATCCISPVTTPRRAWYICVRTASFWRSAIHSVRILWAPQVCGLWVLGCGGWGGGAPTPSPPSFCSASLFLCCLYPCFLPYPQLYSLMDAM